MTAFLRSALPIVVLILGGLTLGFVTHDANRQAAAIGILGSSCK